MEKYRQIILKFVGHDKEDAYAFKNYPVNTAKHSMRGYNQ